MDEISIPHRPQTYELINGPQDGNTVVIYDENPPNVIFAGRIPRGDAHATWSREPSERFPCVYCFYPYAGGYRYVREEHHERK